MSESTIRPDNIITKGKCTRCGGDDTVIFVLEYDTVHNDIYLCGDCLHDLLTAVDAEDARRLGLVVSRRERP